MINALTSGSKHCPYRNHPLTMLMSDSLGGSSKTLMLICASPANFNASETASAFQFASRCKDVKNSVIGGPAQLQAQLAALKMELSRVKTEGKGGAGAGGRKPVPRSPSVGPPESGRGGARPSGGGGPGGGVVESSHRTRRK